MVCVWRTCTAYTPELPPLLPGSFIFTVKSRCLSVWAPIYWERDRDAIHRRVAAAFLWKFNVVADSALV
jgi:hypothetical protein